jgi:hypothetical protein
MNPILLAIIFLCLWNIMLHYRIEQLEKKIKDG